MKHLITRLLGSKPNSTSLRAPRTPDGVTVWAIGDIHGRLDLLLPLVDAIRQDALQGAGKTVAVFLGDYIDRGPDSREVIRFLTDLQVDEAIEWRFLVGNHEQTMLDFIEDPSVGIQWCEFGGQATLASYGLKVPNLKHKPEGWVRLAADLDHKLTSRERAFLKSLELSLELGDYFFAHAGARPGQPLNRQSARDLMWIRNSFLDSPVGFERVVVHGHTPAPKVYIDGRRIGVDTKAYASGVLSAVRFRGEARDIVQAVAGREGEVSIRTPEFAER